MPLTPNMALREASRYRRISDAIAHTRRLDFSDSGRIEGLCRRERVSNRCQLILHTSDKSELERGQGTDRSRGVENSCRKAQNVVRNSTANTRRSGLRLLLLERVSSTGLEQ